MATYFIVPTITINTPTQFDEQGREVRYNIELYSEKLTISTAKNLNRVTFPPLNTHRTDEILETIRDHKWSDKGNPLYPTPEASDVNNLTSRLKLKYQFEQDGTIVIYESNRVVTMDTISSNERHRYKIYRLVSSTKTLGEKLPDLTFIYPNNPIWNKKVFDSAGTWMQKMTTAELTDLLNWKGGRISDWCQQEYVTLLDMESFNEARPTI